jgi:tetratricopeptide (TPR) repeat protein
MDANNGKNLQSRADLRMRLHDVKGAIEDYNGAIRLGPQDSELLADRAAAWSYSVNNARAVEDLTQALELTPGYPEYLLSRAHARQALGYWEESLADFDTALGDKQWRHRVLQEKGDAQYFMGKRLAAVETWKSIPNDSWDMTKAAYACMKLGDKKNALQCCNLALKPTGDFPVNNGWSTDTQNNLAAIWLKAQLLRDQGQLKEALSLAARALKEVKNADLDSAPGIISLIQSAEIDSFYRSLKKQLTENKSADNNGQ